MRRFALILALALGVVMLSGCTGWNWRDPVHPTAVGVGCGCCPTPQRSYDPCPCGTGIVNPFRGGY